MSANLSMRKHALVTASIAAVVVAAIVLGFHSAGKAEGGGFFGPGTLKGDINLVLEVVLVLGLTYGAYLARSGRIEAHRVNQTTWVLVNTALVIFIMAGSMKDVGFKNMGDLSDPRIAITWLHAIAGTLTALAGLWLVLQMNDILPQSMHITWWKKLMRMTLAGYWLVALGGFATYYYFYMG